MAKRNMAREDIARWLQETTEGLSPDECEQVHEFLMEHYADLVDEDWSKLSESEYSSLRRRVLHFPIDPTNLHDWLDIATKGLTAESAQRVGREITEHYRDRMTAERREGRDKLEARAAAMASLGNPKTARHMYRREYATVSDEQTLKPSGTQLGACAWFPLAASTHTGHLEYLIPFGIFYAIYCWVAAWQAPALLHKGHVKSALALRLLGESYIFFLLAFLIMYSRQPFPFHTVWLVLLVLLAVFDVRRLSRVFRKLGYGSANVPGSAPRPD
ncbi:MAG: hypothetical protein HZB26_06390 [Candidatus Hydrogenedentes bacterium]|nr:hypothetical protein [Candidatus Hydrogenedentota bacterium]